jgi:D-alanyl-lipoteichoic acid acyltransferase DltB (MBOAT superfamily)
MLAAVLLTFVVVGAWHGTTASFYLFGLLHGCGVATVAIWDGLLKTWLGKAGRKAFVARPVVRAASTVLTFHFVAMTMMLVNNPLGVIVTSFGAFFAL